MSASVQYAKHFIRTYVSMYLYNNIQHIQQMQELGIKSLHRWSELMVIVSRLPRSYARVLLPTHYLY
jgi:hypothetical protein